MCAPFVPDKGSLCIRLCVCVKLTYYIQLSHTVFDAAAVSGHTCVSACVVCGNVFNHQGAVRHLLEPGRQTGRMKVEVWRFTARTQWA